MGGMVDLWVQRFSGDADQTIDGLVRVFGLPEAQARRIVAAAPCVVKKNLTPEQAAPWVQALRALGATVELKGEDVRKPPPVSLQVPRGRFDKKSLRPSGPASQPPPPNMDVIAYDPSNVPEPEPDDVPDDLHAGLFYEDGELETDAAASAELDLSGSLGLGLDGPTSEELDVRHPFADPPAAGRPSPRPSPRPTSPRPSSPGLAPSAGTVKSFGDDFGDDDPLQPPIPEGALELDAIAPPPEPAPPPRRTPLPPEPGEFDEFEGSQIGLSPDPEPESSGLGTALGFVFLGVGVIVARLLSGSSCFLGGTSSIPAVGFDVLGLVLTGVGVAYVVNVFRDGTKGTLEPTIGAAVVVLSCAIGFGLNFALVPSPERQAELAQERADDDTEDLIDDGAIVEARAALSAVPEPEVRRFVEELYTSGAKTVYRYGNKLVVEMPDTNAARGAVERSYRRFLGYRLDSMQAEATPHPLARFWHITVVF